MKPGHRTRAEPAALKRQLAGRPAEELATLLGKLAAEIPEVGRRTRDFLAQGDPSAAAKRARARLRMTLARQANFDWDGATALSAELEEILDLVEQAVLPQDGPAAFGLLCDFIAHDGAALELADDSNGDISGAFHRACGLMARAAAQVSGPEARAAWEKLMADNGYGCRDSLAALAATALPPAELEQFIARLRAEMRGGGEGAFVAAVTLRGMACGKNDPDLYAEASYGGEPGERRPAVALRVAQQYLAAGRAREAAEHLPASATGCGGYAGDWYETQVALRRALGDTAGERKALWERFCFQPIPTTLEALLAAEPEESRAARRAAALEFVRRDASDLPGKLRLLLAAGEAAEAGRLAVAQHATLNGDHYYALVPLAETFEAAEQPLAATAVYRALLDSILRRASSKPYPHGAAYWHRLEALAARVRAGDWGALKPHDAYVVGIRAGHARKRAFWREVEQHDPVAWQRGRAERQRMFDDVMGETAGEEGEI